jgi:dienelactone hydrolase
VRPRTILALAAALAATALAGDELPETTDKPLMEARKGFVTVSKVSDYEPDGPAAAPPGGRLRVVRYDAPSGKLAAYESPDPGDGKKRPAMILVHGGWGGIGEYEASDAAWAPLFLDAGFVVFVPSWRGECDNPGKLELFFGEVDDALAAVDHVAKLPYVDPTRVYMAGHSTGGTITMLAAEATTKIRAAFPIGGCPELGRVIDAGGYPVHAFPEKDPREAWMRSPIHFVPALKTPTFYFEGEKSTYPADARRMETLASAANAPFRAFIVKGADHFDVLPPTLRLVLRKIREDTGPTCSVGFLPSEVQKAFDDDFNARLDAVVKARAANDGKVLAALKDAGSDLSKPHRIEHFLYAREAAVLLRIVDAVKKRGFEATAPQRRQAKDGSVYFVLSAVKTVVPEPDEIHRQSGFLAGLSFRLKIDYDGWETGVVK